MNIHTRFIFAISRKPADAALEEGEEAKFPAATVAPFDDNDPVLLKMPLADVEVSLSGVDPLPGVSVVGAPPGVSVAPSVIGASLPDDVEPCPEAMSRHAKCTSM